MLIDCIVNPLKVKLHRGVEARAEPGTFSLGREWSITNTSAECFAVGAAILPDIGVATLSERGPSFLMRATVGAGFPRSPHHFIVGRDIIALNVQLNARPIRRYSRLDALRHRRRLRRRLREESLEPVEHR